MKKSGLQFDGSTGRKPSAEARRYVYAVMASMLDHELRDGDRNGWMFGGIEHEPDRRRLTKALHAVRAEMLRKAES